MPDNSAYSNAVGSPPEEAMNYEDYYVNAMHAAHPDWKDSDIPRYGTMSYRIAKTFSGDQNRIESEYQTYLDNLDKRNEYRATQAANHWTAQREDTYYQRAMRDLDKAGINPYILVNEGSIGNSSASSAAKASYESNRGKETKSTSDKGRNVALIMLAVARLIAALA